MTPWHAANAQKNELASSDCETCMENNDPQTRQYMTCGYLPRLDDEYRGWHPPDGKVGFRQNKKTVRLPTVCPGYSTKLPEVVEVLRAHRHWSKGQLALFASEPTDGLLVGIEVLDSEIAGVSRFEMTPENEGGGRK